MASANQYHPHNSLSKGTASTVVSMQLAKIGTKVGGATIGKVAGAVVTPAIWVDDYIKTGSTPGAVDTLIYAVGFLEAPVAIFMGTFKSIMDDEIALKLEHVRSKEPQIYRKYIKPVSTSGGYAPPAITAIKLATKGTTAWYHPIGIWVYILDEKNKNVMDYVPVNATVIYQPKSPLKKGVNGSFLIDRILPK